MSVAGTRQRSCQSNIHKACTQAASQQQIVQAAQGGKVQGGGTCSAHHALQSLASLGQHRRGQAVPCGQQHASQGSEVGLLDSWVCHLGIVDQVSCQLIHSHAHASQLAQILSSTLPYLARLQRAACHHVQVGEEVFMCQGRAC